MFKVPSVWLHEKYELCISEKLQPDGSTLGNLLIKSANSYNLFSINGWTRRPSMGESKDDGEKPFKGDTLINK